MNDTSVKQQIVDSVKSVDTILVTVGQNPSVDELSAALGVTLYLNDIGKHATAVVSGVIPPAITFLKPEKTFENSIDSLRDFVIALDKEKADHLRYKVEGDVVKIFITPYKTVITQKDLEYSKGDYNVEMVLALGVKDKASLDKALTSHGRILHDASVATIGLTPSTLGSMDWNDTKASSLSELAFGLLDGLKDEKKPMTEPVASALLTGIVSATERFSNDKTTATAMTVSARLMAFGANQQLIAAKLREGSKLDFSEDKGAAKIDRKPQSQQKKQGNNKKKQQDAKDSLSITHDSAGENTVTDKKVDNTSSAKEEKDEKNNEETARETVSLEAEASPQPQEVPSLQLAEESATLPPVTLAETPEVTESQDVSKGTPSMPPQADVPADLPPIPGIEMPSEENTSDAIAQLDQLVNVSTNSINNPVNFTDDVEEKGTNMVPLEKQATLEDDTVKVPPFKQKNSPASDEIPNTSAQQTTEDNQNKAILSHGSGKYVGDSVPTFESPLNGVNVNTEPASVDPFSEPLTSTFSAPPETMTPAAIPGIPTTPPPPPTPDFSQFPPMPPQMPDFSQPPVAPTDVTLIPEEPLGQILPSSKEPEAPPAPADSGQFRIPGQQ